MWTEASALHTKYASVNAFTRQKKCIQFLSNIVISYQVFTITIMTVRFVQIKTSYLSTEILIATKIVFLKNKYLNSSIIVLLLFNRYPLISINDNQALVNK